MVWEEYGIHDATTEELEKIKEDDILAWRMVFVFMVATYMRKAVAFRDGSICTGAASLTMFIHAGGGVMVGNMGVERNCQGVWFEGGHVHAG